MKGMPSGWFGPPLTGLCHASPPRQVNLYSDPPQPSHSIHAGTMPQGTKVLSFTIPQPHSVKWYVGPAEGPQASEASGESGRQDVSGGFSVVTALGTLGPPQGGPSFRLGKRRREVRPLSGPCDLKRSDGDVEMSALSQSCMGEALALST